MRRVGKGLPSGGSSAEATTTTTTVSDTGLKTHAHIAATTADAADSAPTGGIAPAAPHIAPPVANKRPRAWQRSQVAAKAPAPAPAQELAQPQSPSLVVSSAETDLSSPSFSNPSSIAIAATAATFSASAASAASSVSTTVPARLQTYKPQYHLYAGKVQDVYAKWPAPDLIVADGAALSATSLSAALNAAPLSDSAPTPEPHAAVAPAGGCDSGIGSGSCAPLSDFCAWYQPHIAAWAKAAKPSTSLWLWNTEIGWASLHPQLQAAGWEFVQLLVWNKGTSATAHLSHSRRSGSYRSPAPVVTEVAALYRRQLRLRTPTGQSLPVPEWLRAEWLRSGRPLSEVQWALGESSALARFLCGEGKWSWPRGDEVETLARYCSQRGDPSAWFYFSLDGRAPLTAAKWQNLKAVWHPLSALTNVWTQAPLSSDERLQGSLQQQAPQVYVPTPDEDKVLRQKPLKLLLQQVYATTNEGAVVWEPFGGLATAAVASVLLGREAYVAECEPRFVPLLQMRLEQAQRAWEENGALTDEELQEAAKSRAGRVSKRAQGRTQLGRTLQGRVL
ncbi:MAG: hypothetical protein H9847_06650 [Candidatus Anaerobiospirillum pullicola]|uniref:Methyltransferase n=1 Tax=Candidatus Anaerobiospirillum pullicola TaxID=2838451 RepID=A0A948TG96_9GAMM|nr:hypothetical protein [Candidatus Anaerobiospirillum pullicola]